MNNCIPEHLFKCCLQCFYLLLIVLQNHVSSTNNMFGQTDVGIAAACVVCFVNMTPVLRE